MPRGPDLAGPDGAAVATEAVATGLQALPHLAEIYPLGGNRRLHLHMLLPAVHIMHKEWSALRIHASCN